METKKSVEIPHKGLELMNSCLGSNQTPSTPVYPSNLQPDHPGELIYLKDSMKLSGSVYKI